MPLTGRQRESYERAEREGVVGLRERGAALRVENALELIVRERQAEGRSHRLGQTRPVHVYTYVCEDTIEERIDAALKNKQRLFDEVVDGVNLDLTAAIDERELFGLFGLAPPPRRDHR